MKYLILLLCLIINYSCSGQKNCSCEKEPLIAKSISCQEQLLRNGSKLYYQFNCDSIWLILEFKDGRKKCLFTMAEGTSFHPYTYRLGYYLMKEYQQSLLFRVGCSATGPCEFHLIDKTTGKLLHEFNELIYNHEDDTLQDFVVYFARENSLAIEFINSGKKIFVPVKSERFKNMLMREYAFNGVNVYENKIKMVYEYEGKDGVKRLDSFVVNLK